MNVPTATYRLQFRNGMDFARAARLAPYLRKLGISHLYASPLFQAMPGSTHGYDVTDHGAFDKALGGIEGFLALSSALREEDLGLILDIVPNHMAASPANPWWRDVLRHGSDSRFAGHFDIDWTAPKLLITVLGQPYGDVLAAGEFALGREADGLVWRYYEHALPLDPQTWRSVFEPAGLAPPAADDAQTWAAWIGEGDRARRLDERLAAFSRDIEAMHALHEAQPWRLTYWRAARDTLTHRRFFEITDLVGVRVEDGRVFDDVHRLLFEMVEAGHVGGIRVDHVDGMADPSTYLAELKEKAPGHPPIWVEKILAAGEALPPDWPVEGTTGYEFARAVAAAVTDGRGLAQVDADYDRFCGPNADYTEMLREAKHEILTTNLAAEMERLTGLALEALSEDLSGRDWGPDSVRRAVVALATAFPVYRSYPAREPPRREDDLLLERVEQKAAEAVPLDDPAPVVLLVALLRSGETEAAARFRTRFQQTTGALMAKAVEDTLFYRFNRLISANEVGAEPEHAVLDAEGFHREMHERRAGQPRGLSATATHDTKRGEDARMRIAAIAEAPAAWSAALERFERIAGIGGEGVPEPGMRWLFYQALLGAWAPEDPALAGRMAQYLVKAAREAKLRTSWVAADETYERGLEEFIERVLADKEFREVFGREAAPFLAMGARKSLVQLALKLTAPGIPDIYQGTERADLSLVDPDNRRDVDFEVRQNALNAREKGFEGKKTALLRHLLTQRRAYPALFAEGSYEPSRVMAAEPWRVLGFLRRKDELVMAVAVELSGREGGGEVRMQPAAGAEGEVLSTWPETGPASGGDLDLAPAFSEEPVSVTIWRRGQRT